MVVSNDLLDIRAYYSFGERVAQRRKELNLTQKELGIALGGSERSATVRVGQYENGTRYPNYDTACKIANLLSTSVESLGYETPIGVKLQDKREAAGLTQLQLGELTGCSEDDIRKYELGTRKPKADKIIVFANALGVELSALLPNVPRNSGNDDKYRELMERYSKLLSENKSLLNVIRVLKEENGKLTENNEKLNLLVSSILKLLHDNMPLSPRGRKIRK